MQDGHIMRHMAKLCILHGFKPNIQIELSMVKQKHCICTTPGGSTIVDPWPLTMKNKDVISIEVKVTQHAA